MSFVGLPPTSPPPKMYNRVPMSVAECARLGPGTVPLTVALDQLRLSALHVRGRRTHNHALVSSMNRSL